MPVRRPIVVLVLAAGLTSAGWLAFGARTAAAQLDIDYSCSVAPSNCNAWFRTNVTITWILNPRPQEGTQVISGCTTTTFVTDTPPLGTPVWCEARYGGDQLRRTKTIFVDKTPPVVTGASVSRPPDGNGWYRAPVGVTFRGSDATSGIRACTSTTYAGPDNAAARVGGNCIDVAGNPGPGFLFGLRYDATGPSVTRGRPARRPDYKGWYNHPVMWRFRGRDALSGLAGCPPVIYRGPDGRHARVIGACSDKAGNISLRGFVLRYDDTPPGRPAVRVIPRDRSVHLRIRPGSGTRRIKIARSPGIGGKKESTLYRGRPRGFTDWRVVNGRRYHYRVVARDRAANRATTRVSAVPRARLLAPPNGAVLAAAPLLRWTRVRYADYYNVQLRRDGRKILSRWPARPRLQLKAAWRYGGHVRQLSPGTYRWDVWPGYGPRTSARYGRRIGGRTFVIAGVPPAQ